MTSVALLVVWLAGCIPTTNESCVIYGEECGCQFHCGSEWDAWRASRGDQCLIGCSYSQDDTGFSSTSPLTDDQCVLVERECQWTDEARERWPYLLKE